MARKALIEKEKRRKKLATRYAAKRKRLKAIVHNRATSPEERFEAALQLQTIPRNAAPVRQRNRCSQTGRPRGYYRRFGLSRIALREMASDGRLPGVIKSSW